MSWPDKDPYTKEEKKVLEEVVQELEELNAKVSNFFRVISGKLN